MLGFLKRKQDLYQFFSTIYYTTCETCLAKHGKILKEIDESISPPLHQGCGCSFLKIENSRQLKYHRELGKKMEERARQELLRRKMFTEALEHLMQDNETAFQLFQEAGHHEFYVDELSEKLNSQTLPLNEDPHFSEKLFKLFVNLNRFHYDKERYGHVPPRMKAARIEHGETIIRALFNRQLEPSQ